MSQFSTQPTTRLPPPPRPPANPNNQQINLPLILVAVSLGLLTVIGTNWYIISLKKAIATDTVTFYRLKVSVDAGDTLREKDLTPIQVFTAMKDDYISELHAVTPQQLGVVKGGKFYQTVQQGQLLTMDMLIGNPLAKTIEPADGKRAVTLPVASEGAPPILDPMTYIDLTVIVTPRGQRTQSMLAMERVRVLAVGDRTAASGDSRRARSYNNITVEVTPDQAQQLATIQQYATDQKFHIVIRNPADTSEKIVGGGVNPELLRALNLPVPTTTRNN